MAFPNDTEWDSNKIHVVNKIIVEEAIKILASDMKRNPDEDPFEQLIQIKRRLGLDLRVHIALAGRQALYDAGFVAREYWQRCHECLAGINKEDYYYEVNGDYYCHNCD